MKILAIILTLLFLTLKLAELGQVKYWSYWGVFAPVMIAFCIEIFELVYMCLYVVMKIIVDNVRSLFDKDEYIK